VDDVVPDYFRAIAVDFDGTLTSAGRPDEMVLDAVAETRQSGRRVVLVTGRILAELREVFPDVEQWFDALVTENGAVVSGTWGRRPVADAVDPRIRHELERRGHEVRSGRVLLACRAEADVDALALINRLGLGYQLVYNRAELMILPAGVTKASGLAQALVDLGLSPHSAVGIGDAENDHSLLETCELGVAVANAVDALKDHADLVLDESDGLGVAAFLRGPVVGGEQRIHPRRWHVQLGTTSSGEPVTVPASQVNVLITGASRSGKSYLTGLFAEQLIDLGYSVVLVDPEGDHTNLGLLPGVAVVGGSQDPPDAEHLAHLISQGRGSVVVDLSQMGADAKRTYYGAAAPRLSELRAHSGLPHWVIFDEAHEPLSTQAAARSLYEPSRKGHCLVTHRPAELGRDSINDLDVLIAMLPDRARRDAEESRMYLESLAAFTGLTREDLATRTAGLRAATAVLVRPSAPHLLVPFTLGTRRTSHVRHWHTYTDGSLDWHRRFFFHRGEHEPTGAVAANLVQFHHELTHCAPAVVSHHVRNGDFSRWVDGVLRDHILASQFRRIERAHPDQADAEAARTQLLTALEQRYLG
jgi:hydroxymethylpyrimidine pyrophosphatase-like HAD family hydrolase